MTKHAGIVLTFLLISGSSGRQQSAQTPSTKPTGTAVPESVTQATFESVYRAAKTVQGATETGVTYVKFGELLQALSTEVDIAKDHRLTGPDSKLLALYQQALGHYAVSASLWKLKIDTGDSDGSVWHGEIPVSVNGEAVPQDMQALITAYHLPLNEGRMKYTGTRYKALPADSVQRVWKVAEATLKQATDLYYGRTTAE